MTAGKKMNWCERCHHAIIPGTGPGVGWVHFSDDDWSGPCRCVSGLVACRPESRRRITFSSPPSVSWVTGTVTGRLGSIT